MARCDTYFQIFQFFSKFRQDRMYLQNRQVKSAKNYVYQINKKILKLKKFPEVVFFFRGRISPRGQKSQKGRIIVKSGGGGAAGKKRWGGGAVGN